MVGERWLSSGLGGSCRGGVLGGFSGTGGVRSDDAFEFPDATENTERREEMLDDIPDSRSFDV